MGLKFVLGKKFQFLQLAICATFKEYLAEHIWALRTLRGTASVLRGKKCIKYFFQYPLPNPSVGSEADNCITIWQQPLPHRGHPPLYLSRGRGVEFFLPISIQITEYWQIPARMGFRFISAPAAGGTVIGSVLTVWVSLPPPGDTPTWKMEAHILVMDKSFWEQTPLLATLLSFSLCQFFRQL